MHILRRALQLLPTMASVMVSIAFASGRGDAQVPGTYRLSICTSPCSATDSGVVRGFLVLFPDSVELGKLPPAARDSLIGQSWQFRRSSIATACFALPTGPAHVDGLELYAGIIRHGLTVWQQSGTGIRVRLYESPDAAYTLDGTMTGREYTGRGEQHNCCGGANPPTFFRAVRIKAPDIGHCL